MENSEKDYSAIVNDNIPLVHSVASRFVGRGMEYDDLFQAGCLGLYKAATRYDENFGTAFSTYAVPVIIGEIRMLFRSGGALKVGRGMKALNSAALAVKERLERESGKEVRVSDIADELGESPEKIAEALAACIRPSSLEEDETGSMASFDETESILTRIDVKRALSMLSEEERTLILLRYRHELSQSNTGRIMAMSQVQVSRKEKKVLEKLRAMLA